MSNYYGNLILNTILYLFIFAAVGSIVIRLKNKRLNKKWWFFIVILLPLTVYTAHDDLYLLYKDLPYALREETKIVEGKVEKVYFPGDIHFVFEGVEYKRNPHIFDPEESKMYRLYFLPHSRFVVDYEKISAE